VSKCYVSLELDLWGSAFGGVVGQESEVDQPVWYRRCDSGACVEIAIRGESVIIRSSIDSEVILTLTRAEWLEFLAGAKDGSFDAL
jgi:hypothetical protein